MLFYVSTLAFYLLLLPFIVLEAAVRAVIDATVMLLDAWALAWTAGGSDE